MFDNFIDSSDNSLDIELLAILKQVNVSDNNILGLEKSTNSLKKGRNISKNGL